MKTMLMLLTLIVLMIAAAGYLLWPAEKKKEKFVMYRPDPAKNAWARDAVLTRVLSSGKLA